jgi:predicted anti-sigma-YlaC factor YlaD
MDCRQVRAALEELLNSERPLKDERSLTQSPELEAHLDQCPECQTWFAQERWTIQALEQLERIQPSSDFTARVLNSLPDAIPEETIAPAAQPDSYLDRIRTAWDSMVSSLARPARRRTLMPALALAATFLVALGLVYVLQGDVPSTPGTAVGASSWLIGIGVVVIVAMLVVALVIWRRKD